MGGRGLAIAGGLLLALSAAGVAWADETISAAPSNRYATPAVTIDQGEKITFNNGDLASHDVTARDAGADGKPLFQSALISGGQSGPVEGVEYLTTGQYAFYCSIHPNMQGTITVTAAGTPVPRPGGGTTPPPSGDTTAPTVSLKPSSRSAASLRKRGRLVVKVTTDERATVKVSAKLGARSAGSVSKALEAGTSPVTIRLSAAARKAVKKGVKLSLRATATDAADNAGRASVSVKLR